MADRSLTATEWLLEQGHNTGGRCEKCWSEARTRVSEGFDSVTDAYHHIMNEWEEHALRASRIREVERHG